LKLKKGLFKNIFIIIFVHYSIAKTVGMVKKVEKSLKAQSIRSGSIASTRNGSSVFEKNSRQDETGTAGLKKSSVVRSSSNGKLK